MAWVRRVRTASGATAVQIAQSVDGRRRIVRHVGSARDEVELGLLMAQARQLLADDAQGLLDLGLSLATVRVPMVPPPAKTLFEDPPRGPSGPVVVAGPRVLATSSALLYQVLAGVYQDLGFDALGDEVLRDLVIARIVEPTSLLDVDRVLADLGRVAASLSTRKRTLRRCQNGQYRDRLSALCFQHARVTGDVSLCLYDVTTLHFEAEAEDDLRKVGYSKERRVDPQIIVGLLVDRQGFPFEIACWEGNKAEKHTIIPVIEAFHARHGDIKDLVVVADAGMLSLENLTALDEAGHRFIVGARVSKAPIDLQSHFRWHGEAFTDGQLIDTLTPRRGKNTDNDPATRVEPVWDKTKHQGSWRAVWAYSAKRFARDNKTLTEQENRAKAVIAGEKSPRTPRFVKIERDSRVLDQVSLARARRLAGLRGYVTNIPAEHLPAAEVVNSYHDLWHVEQSFRMSKSDLRARPLFARRRESIEAHLTIVFAALAVSRTIQTRTGITLRRFLRQLRPLRSATIEINGAVQTLPPAIRTAEQDLLAALADRSPRH